MFIILIDYHPYSNVLKKRIIESVNHANLIFYQVSKRKFDGIQPAQEDGEKSPWIEKS